MRTSPRSGRSRSARSTARRQLAALEIVDYVAIVDEPSAVTPIEALQPDVYVKGPEYANLVLDKSANIFREKAYRRVVRRPHPFHDGRHVFFDEAVALPARRRPRRRRTTRCCATTACCFAICRRSVSRSTQLKRFLADASRAPRLPPGRNDHRRMGRCHGHQPVAEVPLRRGARDRAQPADRRQPA